LNLLARPSNKRLFFLFTLCSLAAVFYIPYFVPQSPSTSDSWIFGYDNRTGIAILLLCVAIGSLWTRGMNLQLPEPAPSKHLPKTLLVIVLAIGAFACISAYRSSGIYGGYGESNYEINRLWLLAQSKRPYIDFEYAYGPLLLYGPLALYRFCRISLQSAYYFFYLLTVLAGFVSIFQVVSRSNYPTPSKWSIFLVLCIPSLPALSSAGTNYTFFRFALPLYFIGIFQKSLLADGTRFKLRPILIATIATAALLLVSPETAVALAFACVALLFFVTYARKSWTISDSIPVAALILPLAVVFALAGWLRILDTMTIASGNANSFPIVVSPAILLYFASLFLCACLLFARWSAQSWSDSNIGLILVSIPLIAAALGRCDPFHIYWNGLGLFVACMFYFSTNRARHWEYSGAFVTVFLLLPFILSIPFAIHAVERTERLQKAGVQTTIPADSISVDRLYPSWHGGFLAPFGFTPNGLGTTLSTRIDYGPYDGWSNNGTPQSIARTLSEIENDPDRAILLRQRFLESCEIHPAGERVFLSLQANTIYLRQVVHRDSIRKSICDFILANYVQAQAADEQHYEYGLWIRRDPQASSSPTGRQN